MEQVPISMQANEVLMSHIVAERLTILIWFNCPQNADGRNMVISAEHDVSLAQVARTSRARSQPSS